MAEPRYKILCVDDEQRVLDALRRHLRERFEVLTATGGAAALEILTTNKDLAVIVSDMRMPEMDGATLLRHTRVLRPSTVRILLTGQADMAAAIKAVNEGQIFRFLTKPCAPEEFLSVMDEAVRQHELITAERVLLQRTVVGAIKALTEIMTLVSPAIFGRAQRLKRRVSALAILMKIDDRWKLEAAALLSHLGQVSLPESLARKLASGEELEAEERERVRNATQAANRLIAHVPRLEPVSALLMTLNDPPDDAEAQLLGEPDSMHVQILRLAVDVEYFEGKGMEEQAILEALQESGEYSAALLDSLRATQIRQHGQVERVEVPVADLGVGVILDEDVMTDRGILIVPRGCEVTPSFIEHICHFRAHLSKPTIAVIRPAMPPDEVIEAIPSRHASAAS